MIIGFSTHKNNPLSAIIRFLTKSKASHCFVVTNLYGKDLVVQSGEFGVGLDYYTRFAKKNNVVLKYEISVPNEQKAMEYVMSQMGASYDYLGLLGAGWVVLMRMFGKKVKNPLSQNGELFCSQFVVKTLCAGQREDYCALDAATISPEELIERFNSDKSAKSI